MDVLTNQTLLSNKGTNPVPANEVLKDAEIICYYFSAHWCPPCRMFTPILADFYLDLKNDGANVECVFVSSDRSEQDMLQYMGESHGDWLAVPWGSSLSSVLKSKYGVTGIPCLVVVTKSGNLISKDGRSDVHRFGASCYQSWLKKK